MRTYPHPVGGLAGGLRLLAGLALLVACARPTPAAAQQRASIWSSSARPGVYQSFDSDHGPRWRTRGHRPARGVAAAQFLARGRRRRSLRPRPRPMTTGVSVKSFGISGALQFPDRHAGAPSTSRPAAARPSTGATVRPRLCPAPRSAARSGALLAGVGFRVGVTPTVMIRGRRAATTATGASSPDRRSGDLVQLRHQPGPEPHAGQQADPRRRRRRRPRQPRPVHRHAAGRERRRPRLPQRRRRRRRARRRRPLSDHGGGRRGGRAGLLQGLRRRQHPRWPRSLPGYPGRRAGRSRAAAPRTATATRSPTASTAAPRRPRGATVDALGCPGDEDGDGVLDGLDRCPRTPTGTHGDPHRLSPRARRPGEEQHRPRRRPTSHRPTRRRPPLRPSGSPAPGPTRRPNHRRRPSRTPWPGRSGGRTSRYPRRNFRPAAFPASRSFRGRRGCSRRRTSPSTRSPICCVPARRPGSRSARTPTTSGVAADNLRITVAAGGGGARLPGREGRELPADRRAGVRVVRAADPGHDAQRSRGQPSGGDSTGGDGPLICVIG